MPASKSAYAPNTIAHFDIAGPNIDELGHFYSSVFGWQVDRKGPGYSLLKTPDSSPGGALVDAEEASLTVGIVVSDLDRTLQAAVAAGGKVIMPKTDNGWVKKGQISDPAGNCVTVIQA